MEKIIWQSTVTADMVEGWSKKEIKKLVDELDNAVFYTCTDMGIN